MGLRLEIISQQRQSLGEIGVKEFGQDGGTIGRSLSNDWALPDRNRFLSAKHAAIDYRSGSYYIIDTSTNGVFVNESERPIGRGNPQRLFDGDRIRIGEYLILSKIEVDEGTIDGFSLDDALHVDPVDVRQRVEAPEPSGYDLLDEQVMTGVGIEIAFDDTEDDAGGPARRALSSSDRRLSASDKSISAEVRTLGDTAARTSRTRSLLIDDTPVDSRKPGASATVQLNAHDGTLRTRRPAAVTPSQQPPASRSATQNRPAAARLQATGTHTRQMPRAAPPSPPKSEDAAGDSSLSAFFRGAGLKNRDLGETERNAMLFLLGQIVRELLTGIGENLHVRAQQKSQLRLANTTIQKQNNNPLKFSAGTSEALTNLLFRTSREYMGPVEAIRDAYADISSHQQNLLKALSVAVPQYVNRLDPIVLEDKFARAGRGALIGGTSKLKHWEMYKDLFQVVANHAAGQLPSQFLEELAQAYEAESEREAALRTRTDKEATQG